MPKQYGNNLKDQTIKAINKHKSITKDMYYVGT